MSGLIYGSEEGRSRAAVAHLASARSQNTRTGILGFTKEKCKSYKRERDFREIQKIRYEIQKRKHEIQKKLQISAAASFRVRWDKNIHGGFTAGFEWLERLIRINRKLICNT